MIGKEGIHIKLAECGEDEDNRARMIEAVRSRCQGGKKG